MNIQMEEMEGRGMWERVWIFHALSECATLPKSPFSPSLLQPGRSLNPILLSFYGGFIT